MSVSMNGVLNGVSLTFIHSFNRLSGSKLWAPKKLCKEEQSKAIRNLFNYLTYMAPLRSVEQKLGRGVGKTNLPIYLKVTTAMVHIAMNFWTGKAN